MKTGATRRLRVAVLLVLGAGYALAAHWFTSNPGLADYGAVLSVAPWLAVGVLLAWQSRHRGLMIAGCIIGLLVLYLERGTLRENFVWVYFIQHAGTLAALAIAFGRTLGRGAEPICTRFHRAAHGTLTDDVARYTRQVTLAWTAFFVVHCLISVGLFMLAPLPLWSLFANLLTPLFVAAMFGAEYLVRLRVLPGFEHVGLLDSVRSIRAASSANAASADSR